MISRRDFAHTLGLVAGAALLPRSATAEETNQAKPKPAPPKLSAVAQAEADARVQLIVARYGARLSPSERALVTRLSNEMQPVLDELRAYALDWSDEPAHIFRAPRRR
jgi:hypothetical protein